MDSVDPEALAESQATLALHRGEAAEREGKNLQAIRYYEQARALEPSLKQLNRRLAVLYDREGDHPRAQAAYQQALEQNPQDADLLNDVGAFHLHREQWPAAESWFRRALTVNPKHHRAANNLAMALAMQNRLAESYDTFAKVVGPAAAYSNLGVLLSRQGRKGEAHEHFRKAVAMDPSIRPARAFIAQLEQAKSPNVIADSQVQPAAHQDTQRR